MLATYLLSKLKAFADTKLNMAEMAGFVLHKKRASWERVNQHFLLFLPCTRKTSFSKFVRWCGKGLNKITPTVMDVCIT